MSAHHSLGPMNLPTLSLQNLSLEPDVTKEIMDI